MVIYKHVLFIVVTCLLIAFASIHTNGQVASPAEPSEDSRSSQVMFTIQIGSYKNRSEAQREINRIRPFAPWVFSLHETVPDRGKWYRIYVGLFSSKEAAVTYAGILAKQNRIAGYWVKSIAPPFPNFFKKPAMSKNSTTVDSVLPKKNPAKLQPSPKVKAPTTAPKRTKPEPMH